MESNELILHNGIPLILTAQDEGGYTVTSSMVPELVTEGDTVEEAMANASDALVAVRELYQETGSTFPIA